MFVVVVGEAAEVAARDAGEVDGLGDREPLGGIAEGENVGVDARVACLRAADQVADANPA